jgi:serine/threonine protein kinase
VALSHGRVVKVGETLYPHEQEGIAFAIAALPDTDPYHLWALVDLLDPATGRLHEIDLLVLGYSCLYLIELKAFAGRMEGDAVDWTWVTPEGRRIWRENPLRLTRRKAQVLKSRLERALPSGIRAPWIEPLVFLSNEHIALALSPDGLTGVVRRDNFEAAITHHAFPGASPRSPGQRIDTPTQRAVVAALSQIGVRPRKGKFLVGPYQLGELLAETNAYQDRVATHRDLKGMTRRARTYLVPEQTSIERRQQLRRAADREAQLLYEVGGHPNILSYAEYVTDAPLGPTVLLEAFDDGVPLDSFLRQHPALTFAERITLIDQVGRALDHCHKKGVVHGGVCPAAVLVRHHPDTKALETRLYNFQLGKGDSVTGTSHATDLAADAWALYQAPELSNDSALRTIEADVFALGAVAFLIVTGREPAANLLERAEVLRTRRCLDPRALDESVPEQVAQMVCLATEEVVASRADDAGLWVEMLLQEVTAPMVARTPETSPLDARKADMVGPYLVEGVLGHGASARVLLVSDDNARQFALKVSLGPEHDPRLRAEAAVLERLNHPRIVRLIATHTFAERTCLLMTLAGEHTLYRELANQGTLSLDYASRWGEDLLSALEHLEEKEIIHRDIKPANLGVGTVARKARTLHLFDFSLAASPMADLRVGTAAYRDPFLPERTMWDHAADRFSAAITLHEVLTSVRPIRRDDGTLEVAAERFDAGARAALVGFFTTAFRRAASERFESAGAMRHAWLACFDGRAQVQVVAPEPDAAPLTDETVRAVAPDTAIAALPLSSRARNALDRAGLLIASGLLTLPDNRLSAIRGAGRAVAKEILAFRTRWQALRPLEAERGAAFFPSYQGGALMVATALAEGDANVLADAGLHTLAQVAAAPASQIEALAARHGLDAVAVTARLRAENQGASERTQPTTLEAWIDALFAGKRKQDQHVRALMGLDGAFAGRLDVTARMLADHLGYTVPPIYVALTKAKQGWATHPTLPALTERVRAHVRDQGGAVPFETAAEWLLTELPHDATTDPSMALVRAAAVLRAIAEVDKDDDVAGFALRAPRR